MSNASRQLDMGSKLTGQARREHRRQRLITLIADHFDNNQARFAAVAVVAPDLVSRYVNGVKGIGEDMRLKIEANTGFADYLDADGAPSIDQAEIPENRKPPPIPLDCDDLIAAFQAMPPIEQAKFRGALSYLEPPHQERQAPAKKPPHTSAA